MFITNNANMALDGLEATITLATKGLSKINIVRYADDFIVTADCSTLLENRVKPAIQIFLAQRGLSLSEEKTHITHINTGFDFLGFNIRKYKERWITGGFSLGTRMPKAMLNSFYSIMLLTRQLNDT
jgi:hypothetical protein